jgi:hypothetical protein
MPFGDFKTVQDVAVAYQISLRKEPFIEPIPFAVDEAFQEEMEFFLTNVETSMSEWAVCEFMIAPVLKKIWKAYSDLMTMWSHVSLGVQEPLVGVPDYFFCRRSPLGVVRDRPYIVVVEAKKDDFVAGWGQCLAAMLAAQQMNGQAPVTIYGCVSNGGTWQFGKLDGTTFTQEFRHFTITDLPALFAALNYLFKQAHQQVLAFAA